MKRKDIKLLFILLGIGLLFFGFSGGTQWYRLAACAVGPTLILHGLFN